MDEAPGGSRAWLAAGFGLPAGCLGEGGGAGGEGSLGFLGGGGLFLAAAAHKSYPIYPASDR
jgi:hypothetical protein